MKRTIETLLKKTATAALLAATMLVAIPANTFAAERFGGREGGRYSAPANRGHVEAYRGGYGYRAPAVVVRPEVRGYRPGVYLGFGTGYAPGYYAPAPRACGFYDRRGYWHVDPYCADDGYYGYPR